jgi:apolipoprotein N-acyltransferase
MLNDAWFKSDAAVMMHAQNGIMTAAAFKVPVVRSSNSGLSCAIDKYGRIQNISKGDMDLNEAALFHFNIDLNRGKTFYGAFGDIFVMMCGFFVASVLLFSTKIFRDRGRRREKI